MADVEAPDAAPGAPAGVEDGHHPGGPRSEKDAAFLQRWNSWMRLPIFLAAVLPLLVSFDNRTWIGLTIEIASWVVFLVDFVVEVRRRDHYVGTGLGKFDLGVVLLTSPWYLLPGAQAGGVLVLLRLARLARLFVASRGARRLIERLGRVAIVAVSVLVVGSLVAYFAEHPTNPGFATVGDALWWGIVTMTTVGYGDIVPKTPTGRIAAVAIMVTGVAVLGVLAGALASFFRIDSPPAQPAAGQGGAGESGESEGPAEQPEQLPADASLSALVIEVAGLRTQVELLAARIAEVLGGSSD
jgi:voltage-gated potassium channel